MIIRIVLIRRQVAKSCVILHSQTNGIDLDTSSFQLISLRKTIPAEITTTITRPAGFAIGNKNDILVILASAKIALCFCQTSSVVRTAVGFHRINPVEYVLNIILRIQCCQANAGIQPQLTVTGFAVVAYKGNNAHSVLGIVFLQAIYHSIGCLLRRSHFGDGIFAIFGSARNLNSACFPQVTAKAKCVKLSAVGAAINFHISTQTKIISCLNFCVRPTLQVRSILHTAGVVHDQDNIHRLGDTLSGDIFAFDRQCDGCLTSGFIICGRFGRFDLTGVQFCRKRSCRQKGEYHHHCHQQ